MLRRNKRKNLEPKRLLVEPCQVVSAKRQRLPSSASSVGSDHQLLDQHHHSPVCSLGSAGSELHHSPISSSSSRSPSPVNRNNNNNNNNMPPKIRLKKQLEEEKNSRDASMSKSHFRPWDSGPEDKELSNDSVTVKTELPVVPLGMLSIPGVTFPTLGFPISKLYPGLLNPVLPSPEKPKNLPIQDEPLCLVKHDRDSPKPNVMKESPSRPVSRPSPTSAKAKQRNYKNMTRERRVEANARERQRVHTITAAFDTLQEAIPTSDDNPANKLSKLSIIKIATSYIMALSRMAGYDYSEDQSEPSVEECLNKCSQLIYSESKSRRCVATHIAEKVMKA